MPGGATLISQILPRSWVERGGEVFPLTRSSDSPGGAPGLLNARGALWHAVPFVDTWTTKPSYLREIYKIVMSERASARREKERERKRKLVLSRVGKHASDVSMNIIIRIGVLVPV